MERHEDGEPVHAERRSGAAGKTVEPQDAADERKRNVYALT